MKTAAASKIRRTQEMRHQRSLSALATGLDFEGERRIAETKMKQISNVYRESQQDVHQISYLNVTQDWKKGINSYKNQSHISSGCVIETDGYKFNKTMRQHIRNHSSVFAAPEPNFQKMRPLKRQSLLGNPEENTIGIRNPISGVNCKDKDSTPIKPRAEFKPSERYNKINMRKYMLNAEMQSLSDLKRQDGRRVLQNNTFKSQIPIGYNSQSGTPAKLEQPQGFGKVSGYETERCKKLISGKANSDSMTDILGYKNALQYRDDYHSTKIADESYQEKVQQTLKQLIQGKIDGQQMTKNKELSSAIF